MRIYLFTVMVSIFSSIYAQGDMSPFATTGFGGLNYFKPNLAKKGMTYQGDPIGIYLNNNGLFLTYNVGQVRPLNSGIDVANTNFNLTTMGYQIGKDFKWGTESILSASVKPYVAIGAVAGSFPKSRVFEEIPSLGLFIAPGIDFRISQLNIGFQYQMMGLLHSSFDYDKSMNFGRGFLSGLAINIGFSNSFDLLTPQAYTFQGLNVDVNVTQKEWIEYGQRYGKWYRYRVTQTTTTTTKTPGQRTLTLVTPFFGIGPIYTMNHEHDRSAKTAMQGINGGFRFAYFMVDGYYEYGEYGFKDPASWADIVTTYPVETNFDFSYRVPVTNYGAKIGFNITKFFTLKTGFEVHSNAKTAYWYVPFARVHVFLNVGETNFVNAPTYTYANAAERINDFYLVNRPDAKYHPDQLPEKSLYTGWGVNIELGSIYVQWNKTNYTNYESLTNSTYSVGANIPIGRVGASLVSRRKYKKAWKAYGKNQ
jgi:hypothetical protein